MAIWDSRSIYLTSQGSKMLAKAETGGVPMTITRAVTGSGRTSEIEGATSVSDSKQTLQIGHKSADVQGSLAGLDGTYNIELPYDKASKLKVGNTFSVNVQLGQYKQKTVVGEISW